MNEGKILLITEANEQVASGHLMECLVCRQYLNQMCMEADLLVNGDMPVALKERIEDGYFTYQSNIQKEIAFLIDFVNGKRYSKILFNLRKIENDFLLQIKENTGKQIICIDEFGNRRLDADIIVNPMIDEYYWKYNTRAKLYCGAEYLVLPVKLQEFRKKIRKINEKIKTVTVSMGGVDIGDTTLHLAEWFPLLDDELEINLVLGGAYQKEKELRELIANSDNIRMFHNISYLDRLFFESDLAFCAGGNTLHELAVLGVPAIVVPSMPHEVRNGKAFESAGFSFCGSIAEQFSFQELVDLYSRIETKQVRENMRDAGKKMADGRGYERIYEILKD
jgi:spore coat polysaccharide biosynthesis predicted glycosyltransferase SpsG